MGHRFNSLWFRLIFGLCLGSIIAVLAASLFLFIRFKSVSTLSREGTLQGQARLIGELFRASGGTQLVLPEDIAPYYRDGTGKFAILNEHETLLVASTGVTRGFQPIDLESEREFFAHPQPDGEPTYHGISIKVKDLRPPVWVQVVFKDNDVIFDSVLEEFVQDIAWIWSPFVLILLAINFTVIKIGLKPLVSASAQASAIGPAAVSMRLSETGMPEEVLNFVRAINRALDRLEDGYKAQQRAIDQQRQFIADAAHELRTPLAALQIQIDNLAAIATEHSKQPLTAELNAGIRRASSLLRQMLSMARFDMPADPLQFQRVDVANLVTECLAEYSPMAENKGVDLGILSQEKAFVKAIEPELKILVGNLIDNAVRYTPSGGLVDISVRNLGSSTVIQVADTGCGVDETNIPRLFDRFFRAAPPGIEGSGLGLAIVQAIAKRHNFAIALQNRKDRTGFQVTVTCPWWQE